VGGPEADGGSSDVGGKDGVLQARSQPAIDDHCCVGFTLIP